MKNINLASMNVTELKTDEMCGTNGGFVFTTLTGLFRPGILLAQAIVKKISENKEE